MTPSAKLTTHTSPDVPEDLERLLQAHLPYSLPVLRRLQHAKHKDGMPPNARAVVVSSGDVLGSDQLASARFTAAYVDYGGGPDTQMWLFSTLEEVEKPSDADKAEYRLQIEELVRELVKLGKEYGKPTVYPGGLLLGSLHTAVRDVLIDLGRAAPRATGFYDKWLFQAKGFPENDAPLPDGMRWDTASLDDCRIVVSRTDIPRVAETLFRLQNLIIRIGDGTPIAWAFLGFDGSLCSLHCEEPYRRRGLAKALGAKLMRTGCGPYATDGWTSADVAASNAGSRGMCKSLNGEQHWEVSWMMIDITEDGLKD